MEVVLNIAAQIIKMNLKNVEEMRLVLEDLGIDGASQKAVIKSYQDHYLKRITTINTAYEQTEDNDQVDAKTLKKFPLNFAASDEGLSVSQPKLVDVDWEVDYVLSSKNLNKLF